MSQADSGTSAHLDERGAPRIIEPRFVVEDALSGQRLDHYLKRKIPRLSRTRLQEVIRTQLERASGRPNKPHSPVAAGEELIIRTPARPEPPCPRTFDVLHRDEDVMVIDKPAGLPVHASAKFYFNTLTRVLAERYPEEALQICHRLDRETSGCLVVARHREAARVLKRAFHQKKPEKTYIAIVYGRPGWTGRELIDLPLGLVDPDRGLSIRMEVRPDALPAQTRVRVLETCGDYSVVECQPVTGRQHQIRAHLAATGHPIVGDKLYAHGDEAFMAYCDGGLTTELLQQFRLSRQALHAARIRIPHPRSEEVLEVEAPLPDDLAQFVVAATAEI